MTERAAAEEMEEERQSGGVGERQSQRPRRCCRHEKPPLPQEHPPPPPPPPPTPPTPGKREHIDKVAKFVAEEEDSQVEEILLKLLRLTRNHERWGFLSADDPRHAYYARKVADRRRAIRGDNR